MSEAKGITIYRGGSHRIECRDGLHVQVDDDGAISPAGKCQNWVGGCPAKRMRDAAPELAKALIKTQRILRAIVDCDGRIDNPGFDLVCDAEVSAVAALAKARGEGR